MKFSHPRIRDGGKRPYLSAITDEIEKNKRHARTLPPRPGRLPRITGNVPRGPQLRVGGKRKGVKVTLARRVTDF